MTLAELKVLAEAATPGEWRAIFEDGSYFVDCHDLEICGTASRTGGNDMAFIAAARPGVVLAMIAMLGAVLKGGGDVSDDLNQRTDLEGLMGRALRDSVTFVDDPWRPDLSSGAMPEGWRMDVLRYFATASEIRSWQCIVHKTGSPNSDQVGRGPTPGAALAEAIRKAKEHRGG